MLSFLKQLFDSTHSRQRIAQKRKTHGRQMLLESLEDRKLMTGGMTSFMSSGLLYVDGSNNADLIQIKFENGRISVPGV